MALSAPLPGDVRDACRRLAATEAGPSLVGRPVGAAPGGGDFELAVRAVWVALVRSLAGLGLAVDAVRSGEALLTRLSNPEFQSGLIVALPPRGALGEAFTASKEVPAYWGRRVFAVTDLVDGAQVARFAPPTAEDSPQFFGARYPGMFGGAKTAFDFNVVCERSGVFLDKMLFEYKAGKSTNGARLDGNVHERLGYQSLQYLEVALRHPNTSFNVIASSAFARYRNKYHVTFNQQAERLGETYSFFRMRFVACESEYLRFFAMLTRFVRDGELPPTDYRSAGAP